MTESNSRRRLHKGMKGILLEAATGFIPQHDLRRKLTHCSNACKSEIRELQRDARRRLRAAETQDTKPQNRTLKRPADAPAPATRARQAPVTTLDIAAFTALKERRRQENLRKKQIQEQLLEDSYRRIAANSSDDGLESGSDSSSAPVNHVATTSESEGSSPCASPRCHTPAPSDDAPTLAPRPSDAASHAVCEFLEAAQCSHVFPVAVFEQHGLASEEKFRALTFDQLASCFPQATLADMKSLLFQLSFMRIVERQRLLTMH